MNQTHINNFWNSVQNSLVRKRVVPTTGAPKIGNIGNLPNIPKLSTQVAQKSQHFFNRSK